jgi:DNA-binding response OmpR family regulator
MLQGVRVLVVEREILIAIDIQRILEDAGAAEVVLARAASDAAIADAGSWAYGLAVIDAQMGAPEAVMLVRALHAAGVPVILVSADRTVAARFTAQAVLEKPFTGASLLAACAAVRCPPNGSS